MEIQFREKDVYVYNSSFFHTYVSKISIVRKAKLNTEYAAFSLSLFLFLLSLSLIINDY